MISLLRRILIAFRTDELPDRIDKMDCRHREIKHDLRNTQARLELIKRLVERMQQGERGVLERPPRGTRPDV